jgi:FkbM family methyltransferase
MNYKRRISGIIKSGRSYGEDKNSVHKLLDGKNLVLYGGGDGFITFSLFILGRYGITPTVILDRRFASGQVYHGIPASSPSEYKPAEEEKKNAVVVVTVGKKEFHEEIFGCLKDMGFKNVVLSTDIYEYHLHYPPKELEEKGLGFYADNESRILKSFDLLEDDLSREVFFAFVRTHVERKPARIPDAPIEGQYFPGDIPLEKGYARFINCGAYCGDTIINLIERIGKIESIACFEPDNANFRSLSEYLTANSHEIARHICAYPCGVHSSERQLQFSTGDLFNSRISDRGATIIQCVAIDHVLPGFNPTFINMDIEGAEMEALAGAEETIKRSKPDLAICVYHSPSHVWEIPLYLHSLNSGYRFYLRNYTSFVSETVLYATSREGPGDTHD